MAVAIPNIASIRPAILGFPQLLSLMVTPTVELILKLPAKLVSLPSPGGCITASRTPGHDHRSVLGPPAIKSTTRKTQTKKPFAPERREGPFCRTRFVRKPGDVWSARHAATLTAEENRQRL